MPPTTERPASKRVLPALTRLLARRSASWAAQGIIFVALVFALGAYQTRRHLRARVAPDFVLPELSGQRISLADYRGKKVLLHFFATWCGVCQLELPSLRGLARRLGPNEALIAVVEDSTDAEAVRGFAREHALNYPVLLGSPEVFRAYRVSAFPTNYFVNGDGTIAGSTVGLSTRLGMATHLWLTDAGGAPGP